MDVQATLPALYQVYPEDDMPENQAQRDIAARLIILFERACSPELCFVTGNVQIVPRDDMKCGKVVPDVMIFLGLELTSQQRFDLKSWNMNEPNRPAPSVVFEIVSEATWENDLRVKPQHYGVLGVREYFAFDPQGYWRLAGGTRRLQGWSYELGRAEPVEIEGDEEGRLWSETLQSFLVVEGRELRVYDRAMNERLSGEEAEKIARQQAEIERRRAEALRRQADAARQQAEAARRQAEVERQQADAARQQAEVERQQTEVERQQAEQRAERLARKLRELNIDPDEL